MNPPPEVVAAGSRHEKPTLTTGRSEGNGDDWPTVGVVATSDGDASGLAAREGDAVVTVNC